jgi:Heterokaryon incompatibility protein (HET)
VIDVGPPDGSEIPYLRTSGEQVKEWVTLSHCWGKEQPLKTTMQTITDHERGLPLTELPKLFHDAIWITRKLGYRYLWIDSLCIIQECKEDWVRESSNMRNIYKHSVITISADNCRDSRDNILDNHDAVLVEYLPLGCNSSKEGFQSQMYAFSAKKWEDSHNSDYKLLGSRAWALQEEILSPRTLYWTPSQVVWNCRCATRSEENPTEHQTKYFKGTEWYPTKVISLSSERLETVRQQMLKGEKNSEDKLACDPLQLWYYLVMQFCTRKITYEQDSFPAISGLAKEVQRHTGFDYYAGLWAQDLHNALLWSTEGHAALPSTYVAPSWSWASIKRGATIYPACEGPLVEINRNKIFTPVAEVLEVRVVLSGGDKFGQILSGRLQVNAPFKMASGLGERQIRLTWAKDKLSNMGDGPYAYKILPSTITCWLDNWPRGGEEDDGSCSTLHSQLSERGISFVHIASIDTSHAVIPDSNNYFLQRRKRSLQDQSWGLILEPVPKEEDLWKRIGIARIADGLVDGWGKRVVTIV